MIKRPNHISLGFALSALVLATGCYEKKSTQGGNVNGRLTRLAKSGAGNGDGYLGLVGSAYQVLPGYECNDGTTSRLAYAAALVKTDEGKLFLASDQCENKLIPIHQHEVRPLDKDGNRVLVRGGIFEFLEAAPTPVNRQGRYRQIHCTWKKSFGGSLVYNGYNAHESTINIRSNMAGDVMDISIHAKYRNAEDVKFHAWVTKFSPVTFEQAGSTVIYTGTTTDSKLTVDTSRPNHYKGTKFYGTIRFASETGNVQLENAQCAVNRPVSFEPSTQGTGWNR